MPYTWLSAFLGVSSSLVAGIATVALTYLGLIHREERASTGHASGRTVRRLWATTAAVAGFVLGGGPSMAIFAIQVMGLATALLTDGIPVGLLMGALAAVLISGSIRRCKDGVRPP